MYSRARVFIDKRFAQLSLRVSCWNLPPVATHLACFLLGTLLFEPDSSGRVPSGILVPWSAQRIQGSVRKAADYEVLSRSRKCRLAPEPVRLWSAEEKKIFVVLPKTKGGAETFNAMQKADAWLEVVRKPSAPLCARSNVIVYP